ncbi:MAG: 16S rRNA (guanine(966)-N(2))-methyltransferase RsmD [Deltaproteobacteria bacterium]|nr:16S rRNA (guanine(966)-N(2))-methyltransferase RsmD [Deltaproteobacteria bacterium]
MRILAGTAKGKKLTTPANAKITRPALAKVREAIFNKIGNVDDLLLVDVFAGTGSLGLEGLSRGAEYVYFIENHPAIIKCLIKNLQDLDFTEKARILKRSLPAGAKVLRLPRPADIVFCDPPYDKDLLNPTLLALCKADKVIDHKTWVIVEHTSREVPEIKDLEVFDQKKYGQTLISYLRLKPKGTS